jgi:hypothetical protein
MNSQHHANEQMRRRSSLCSYSSDVSSSCSVPSPLDMIAASMMCSMSFEDSTYDASSFPSPASLTSSHNSHSSQESTSSCISMRKVGGLSRSRCLSNLSALGGHASETSILRQAAYKAGPNHGWGYFVDTPSTWRDIILTPSRSLPSPAKPE